jgi:hypothetical protein
VKRTALTGLPRALVLAAASLLTLSLLETLVALGIFLWYDTEFWYYFEVGPVLMVAALILTGFSVRVCSSSTSGARSRISPSSRLPYWCAL